MIADDAKTAVRQDGLDRALNKLGIQRVESAMEARGHEPGQKIAPNRGGGTPLQGRIIVHDCNRSWLATAMRASPVEDMKSASERCIAYILIKCTIWLRGGWRLVLLFFGN